MITTILNVIIAIPKIKEMFEQLIALYIEQKIESMKFQNREAIRKALYELDQREIEKAMQSNMAGKPSLDPDAVIVDKLNWVRDERSN